MNIELKFLYILMHMYVKFYGNPMFYILEIVILLIKLGALNNMCIVVTCWERADLLALVCGVQL